MDKYVRYTVNIRLTKHTYHKDGSITDQHLEGWTTPTIREEEVAWDLFGSAKGTLIQLLAPHYLQEEHEETKQGQDDGTPA